MSLIWLLTIDNVWFLEAQKTSGLFVIMYGHLRKISIYATSTPNAGLFILQILF